jgi:hypothetical protein
VSQFAVEDARKDTGVVVEHREAHSQSIGHITLYQCESQIAEFRLPGCGADTGIEHRQKERAAHSIGKIAGAFCRWLAIFSLEEELRLLLEASTVPHKVEYTLLPVGRQIAQPGQCGRATAFQGHGAIAFAANAFHLFDQPLPLLFDQ